jgi:hypothetical protein
LRYLELAEAAGFPSVADATPFVARSTAMFLRCELEPEVIVPNGKPYTSDELTRIARRRRQQREIARYRRRWEEISRGGRHARGGRSGAERRIEEDFEKTLLIKQIREMFAA